jgi:predicted nucleotidyltransferase component of viral defense system
MIPTADIIAWRADHPWVSNAQVEQDLIISRAMLDMFALPSLRDQLAMRGGTALHKLYLTPASRYSEDIDLVQTQAVPIGRVMDGIHETLDPWLGTPRRIQKENDVKLIYRVDSEIAPIVPIRIKIEINTREHTAVEGWIEQSHSVSSRWYEGRNTIPTFTIEELLGTKLRALFQRRKGRDLFDLWHGLTQGLADPARIADIFQSYMSVEGQVVSQNEFSRNLAQKMTHAGFQSDLPPLLRPGMQYDAVEAHRLVEAELIGRI